MKISGGFARASNFVRRTSALAVLAALFLPAGSVADAEVRAKRNWLESLYPSVNACTPIGFYYDDKAGKSARGFLEERGYSPINITHEVAEYVIDEPFFGMRAIKILIPHHMSIFSITLNVSADISAKILQDSFGEKILIYPDNQSEPAIAYLYPDGPSRSSFVCNLEPE